jgi:multidrug resistance efflux pump
MSPPSVAPLKRILIQFKEYYPILVIYSICVSVLTLAIPISVQSLVNTFAFGPYLQPIFMLSLILLGLLSILGLMKSLQYLLVEYLQRKLYAKITADISQAYSLLESNSVESIRDKSNRYFDIVLIHKTLTYLVIDGVAIALQTTIGLFLLILYHPLFLLLGALIIFSILLPLRLFLKSGMHTADEESLAKYKVADHLKSIAYEEKYYLTEDDKIADTDQHIQGFLQMRSDHFKTVFIQNVLYVGLYAVLNASLLALGGYLVIKNQLSVGQLIAAEIVVNSILYHFLNAKKYLEAFYDISAAAKKLNPFYDFIESKKGLQKHTPLEEFARKFKSVSSVYTPKNYKKIFRNFGVGTVSLILILLIAPWQQYSRGFGKVTAYNPNDRIQKITAPLSGIVEEWLVQDGQFVKKGDPIVKMTDNDPNYLLRLESQRDAAIAKFDAAKGASDTARLNFHRQEELVKEGLTSPKDFEVSKIKYQKLRAEEAMAAASLVKTEVDLSRQQQQVIAATRDGQILRILQSSGTTNVKAGQPLADFVPKSEESAVEIYIDGNDLPLVYVGRKVRIQFEGWPAIQFTGWPSVAVGSFGGIVSAIDPSVSENGDFRILVQPDPEDPNPWPDQRYLRQGAKAMGIVILNQVSIGYELWRQINGFPKSIPREPKKTDFMIKVKRK